jgi:hypothetical protein
MLHAPERDGSGVIVDEELTAERRDHLVAAGRFPLEESPLGPAVS